MCHSGTVVAFTSLKQEVTVSKYNNLSIKKMVHEFREFYEIIYGKLYVHICKAS